MRSASIQGKTGSQSKMSIFETRCIIINHFDWFIGNKTAVSNYIFHIYIFIEVV